MRTAIYSLRDILTNTLTAPFHATHDIAAVRAVVHLINDPQAKASGNGPACYPSEFSLVRLCAFDDVEGAIMEDNSPVTLARVDRLSTDRRYYPDAPASNDPVQS